MKKRKCILCKGKEAGNLVSKRLQRNPSQMYANLTNNTSKTVKLYK